MKQKTVSGIMLSLLLVSMLTLTFDIQPVKADWTWTETIYIRADGSVYPDTAPISTVDNIIYTLTDNIIGDVPSESSAIAVQRNNIVVDGAGYTVQGTGTWSKGLYLLGRSNVTIKNINIKDFRYGVEFDSTFHSILSANNMTSNVEGVRLYLSSNNSLYGNSIEANEHFGMYLWESSSNTISGNEIAATYGYTDSKGVFLGKSSNNVIDGNTVIGNDYGGIVLLGSSNNIISANEVRDNGDWANDYGIELTYCSMWDGCWPTSYSDNNTIEGNNITRNTSGIRLCASQYNTVVENNVINNTATGVQFETASYNTFRNNIIAGNKHNFGVFTFHDEVRLSTYAQDIDTSNTVNGKPIYYLVDQEGLTIDSSDMGYLGLVNCTNIHIKDVTLSNNGQGLLMAFTTDSTMENATITDNRVGIHVLGSDANTITASNITDNNSGISLYRSSLNHITENTLTHNGISIGIMIKGLGSLWTAKRIPSEDNIISSNTMSNGGIGLTNPGTTRTIIANNTIKDANTGISLSWGTCGNKIYHNNFLDNTKNVYINAEHGDVVNTWDDGYPSGGNYWSDHNGTDTFSGPNQDQPGGDGLGDTPYDIDANNTDNFPLMGPISSFDAGTWGETTYQVKTISNSTVSDFHFSESEKLISFTVTGPEGTVGFCRVTIPNILLGGPYVVLVNDSPPLTISEWTDGSHTFIHFTYVHSTKTVEITGTTVVPEFASWISTLLLFLILASALVIHKRKLFRTAIH